MANRRIGAVVNYKQRMIFGGSFARAGELAAYSIATFDGEATAPLGSGTDGVVNTLSIFGELLIVGGTFTKVFQPLSSSSTSSGILQSGGLAAWNGEEWQLVGKTSLLGVVTASIVNGTRLFVAGRFDDADRKNNLGMFDGSSWSSVCSIHGSCGVTGGEINALVTLHESLYIGGGFTQAGGLQAERIARWDGRQWYSLGSPNADVHALAALDGQIMVGGDFTMIDGREFNHVACYRSGSWVKLGSGVGGSVYSIAALNACIYVGGEFATISGDSAISEVPIKNAARWCTNAGDGWIPVDWGDNLSQVGVCRVVAIA